MAEFDRLAETYDTAVTSTRDFEFVMHRLPPGRDRTLDVGCGTGKLAQALAREFRHVDGIDPAEEMLGVARRRAAGLPAACSPWRVAGAPNLAFHRMSAESLGFPDATFDFVVSVTALHHADFARALPEVRRVLRPGGRFLSVDIFAYFFGMRRQPPWLTYLMSGVDCLENTFRDGPRAAWRSLRAVTTPEWIRHLNHDAYRPAPEFDAAYAAHLPGATFGRASRYFRYCLWDKPTQAPSGPSR